MGVGKFASGLVFDNNCTRRPACLERKGKANSCSAVAAEGPSRFFFWSGRRNGMLHSFHSEVEEEGKTRAAGWSKFQIKNKIRMQNQWRSDERRAVAAVRRIEKQPPPRPFCTWSHPIPGRATGLPCAICAPSLRVLGVKGGEEDKEAHCCAGSAAGLIQAWCRAGCVRPSVWVSTCCCCWFRRRSLNGDHLQIVEGQLGWEPTRPRRWS